MSKVVAAFVFTHRRAEAVYACGRLTYLATQRRKSPRSYLLANFSAKQTTPKVKCDDKKPNTDWLNFAPDG
jgi:hypothetical protein